MHNLMPKIAEMLGVKMNEWVIVEYISNPSNPYRVSITNDGLKIDESYGKSVRLYDNYFSLSSLSENDTLLCSWLRGYLRIKGNFPKDGDKVFAFSNGEPHFGCANPHIEDFKFNSNSQFHLLLKEKGLLHETVEEAIKCFEKDYNTFKEMQDAK